MLSDTFWNITMDFIKAMFKLIGCEEDFVCLVWPSQGKVFFFFKFCVKSIVHLGKSVAFLLKMLMQTLFLPRVKKCFLAQQPCFQARKVRSPFWANLFKWQSLDSDTHLFSWLEAEWERKKEHESEQSVLTKNLKQFGIWIVIACRTCNFKGLTTLFGAFCKNLQILTFKVLSWAIFYWRKTSLLPILICNLRRTRIFFSVFDEAALTDDLLVQLVEALKKHKESVKSKAEVEAEIAKEKDNGKHEGTMSRTELWHMGYSAQTMCKIREKHHTVNRKLEATCTVDRGLSLLKPYIFSCCFYTAHVHCRSSLFCWVA